MFEAVHDNLHTANPIVCSILSTSNFTDVMASEIKPDELMDGSNGVPTPHHFQEVDNVQPPAEEADHVL